MREYLRLETLRGRFRGRTEPQLIRGSHNPGTSTCVSPDCCRRGPCKVLAGRLTYWKDFPPPAPSSYVAWPCQKVELLRSCFVRATLGAFAEAYWYGFPSSDPAVTTTSTRQVEIEQPSLQAAGASAPQQHGDEEMMDGPRAAGGGEAAAGREGLRQRRVVAAGADG